MTLTPQQRLQVFMLYPNAEIQIENSFFVGKGKIIGFTKSESEYFLKIEYGEGVHYATYETYIEDCQLILRSIDQITPLEEREIGLLMEGKPLAFKGGFYTHKLINNIWVEVNLERWLRACDYLRSKNIALPYMGIDLFEEGVAIKEK